MSRCPSQRQQASTAIERGYVRLAACRDDGARVRATTALILAIFDDFYSLLCEYPYRAKRAFELRDPHASVQISRERLGLYSRYIAEHGPRLVGAFPALASESTLWEPIDRLFVAMIVDRYEADTAFSFAHSLRRNICQEVWRPVAYSFPPPSKLRAFSMASVHRRLPVTGRPDAALITSFLSIPEFSVPWRSLERDAQRIVERVTPLLYDAQSAPPAALDVIEAGFFRDRRAFVVGRWVREDDSILPFVVALQNGAEGIYAEAVLHRVADIHGLFSSALANLHVTTRLYYQTCVFLYSLMPRRPLGHHYSTIGYNHVGKIAILNEIVEQMRTSGQRFQRSPGAPGTVAVGFTFDACDYHLKVIRDQPTRVVQMGALPGRSGGDREVSPGPRDQPRGQHVGQCHVFQFAAGQGHVRAGPSRGVVRTVEQQRSCGRGRCAAAVLDRSTEDHSLAGVSARCSRERNARGHRPARAVYPQQCGDRHFQQGP